MSDSGTLVTHVFTSRGELPIADAAVSFVQRDGSGRQRLFAIRTSDESGNTAPLTIDTPDAGLSLRPEQPFPFAVVDVWVERLGYQLLVIRDVQIFPGIESIQSLPLIPLPEFGERVTGTVLIPAQDL